LVLQRKTRSRHPSHPTSHRPEPTQ
jgi:hypothetical protein